MILKVGDVYSTSKCGDIDYEDYGVCSRCRKELYCCSCDGGI